MSSPSFVHFVPYVNGYDLLERALLSVKSLWLATVVIDNRNDLSLPDPAQDERWNRYVEVYQPIVSLTTAQTMNAMTKLAIKRGCDYFTWMHSDAECAEDIGVDFIDYVQHLNERWGAVFTNYDCLAAYNVAAINEVGGWDALRFPYYFLDNDIHNALEAAGYTLHQSPFGDKVLHHNNASNTIKKDAVRRQVNSETFAVCERLYKDKWGLR